jgi:predicted Ser/Thr protein kinase
MTKCPSCSTEIPAASRFCNFCGAVTTPPPEPAMGEDTMAMPAPSSSRPPSHRATPPSQRSSVTSSISSSDLDEGRFPAGSLVAERYRIIELLGRGGMGEVYRATDLRLGQQVALKFLPAETASDPDTLARFNNEVRIARQVSHPNVCRVYDIGEVDGQPYLSMEYVDGEDLGALLRRIGRLPTDTAVEMARKLCAGLAAAHDKGVLHRDLKPANIMIDARGQVLITDFGLAGIADRIQGSEIRHGTPAYMAPEQLSGKEVTTRSDIYALGLVLYEMFTGKRAHDASSVAEMTRLRQDAAPPSLVTHVRDLDPAVERVVRRCLDPDPQNRPATALAVAAALPGGDPLAAALAAGETPSPELVAAASEREALPPLIALACFVGILIFLASVPFFVTQSAWIAKTPMENPPDALAQKARDFAQRFGYTNKPFDSASGLFYAGDYLTDLRAKGKSASTIPHLSQGMPAPIHFWYRGSPRSLIAAEFGSNGDVSAGDPSMDISGMVKVELDLSGRLVYFEAVPPEQEKLAPAGSPPDGAALLTAAGLDPARFQRADPEWVPLAAFDQRAAWVGTYPDDPNPLRVEAASWRGKLVYFHLISPWTRAARLQPKQSTRAEKIGQGIGLTILVLIVAGACLLARHNIRLGRGDWRSAFRLTAFLFCLSFAAWALTAHHVASFVELINILMGLSFCFLFVALIWVLYVALEPYVRRQWPQTIISWTRLMAGRVRDPVVGGHVLVGIVYGVFLAATVQLFSFWKVQASGVPDQTIALDTLLSVPRVASILAGIAPNSLLSTLGIFFVFFLLRTLLRREWLAAVAFVLLLTAIATGLSDGNFWVALPIRLVQYGVMMFIMLRFGLLPFVVGQAMVDILILFPVTMDFSAWYAGSAIFALSFIVVLGAWAFHTALGGRPLFKQDLLDG